LLVHQSDGAWTVVDCHSTNGTYLNDDSDPISCDEPVALREGDQLHLGAWTTITLRSVPRQSTALPRRATSTAAANQPQ
jgi:hypothetical protein